MTNYLRLNDTISSKEGKAYITIDGRNRELFEISRLSARLDLKIQKRQLLGHRMVQHKITGAEGTGTLQLYFISSEMMQLAKNYIKNGSISNLKLQVINEDGQSTVGRQEVMLTNVMLKNIPVTELDDSSDEPLTITTEFTFDDLEVLSSFEAPENYRV